MEEMARMLRTTDVKNSNKGNHTVGMRDVGINKEEWYKTRSMEEKGVNMKANIWRRTYDMEMKSKSRDKGIIRTRLTQCPSIDIAREY